MENFVFIGGGHICQAMVSGLIAKESINPSSITIATPHPSCFARSLKMDGVNVIRDNKKAATHADILFITVKPNVVKRVIHKIRDTISSSTLVVSVAACVDFALLSRYFGKKKVKLIRIMPNIPVAERKGVIGVIVNSYVTSKERKMIMDFLQPLGLTIDCKSEEHLDKLSLISGCGPAVVGYLIQTLKEESTHLGFTPHQAETIALKTFEGTIAHMKAANISPRQLVSSVATPGGITERIIDTLSLKYPQLLRKSLRKGYDRITNVSKLLKESV